MLGMVFTYSFIFLLALLWWGQIVCFGVTFAFLQRAAFFVYKTCSSCPECSPFPWTHWF
jgi:hypothetical protein